MAQIQKYKGKRGLSSYRITVTKGITPDGKKIRHYKSWSPPAGMSEAKAKKEVQKIAVEFENSIDIGFQLDQHQTFHDYAMYWLDLKKTKGLKQSTLNAYMGLLKRIDPAIGWMQLGDIRPQHLNRFYHSLIDSPNIKQEQEKCINKGHLSAILEKDKISKDALARKSHISHATINTACSGKPVSIESAMAISAALGYPLNQLFSVKRNPQKLSNKTARKYHQLIHSVLGQAEKEMIVAYNAASKAEPPIAKKKQPNYFQPEQLRAIMDALDRAPEQWRMLTHLLIVTGCRRGEIAGLKWSRVDFEKGFIHICMSLGYSGSQGTYETTTKTGEERYLKLPKETITMLKHHKVTQTANRLKAGDRWHDTGFVFTRWDGRPLNPTSITTWLRKFSEKNNLPHINPHAFRHSAASILIAGGVDIVTVSKQLGHKQVSTTEDYYAHMIDEKKAQALECITDALLMQNKKEII